MNEIIKLYENARVAKIGTRKCTTTEYLDCQNYCFISEDNKCDKFSYQYPPFTEERQIKLIKWLAHKANNGLLINIHITNGGTSMVFDNLGHESTLVSSFISFEECIAKSVNYLWLSLTEEERKQIRNILEG